jgi:hypothetical protein
MRVTENTTDRLAMRAGVPVLHPTTLVFDKKNGTATVERKILFYPFEARTFPLKSICDVHVVKRSSRNSSSYKPALSVDVGRPIELSGFSRETSKKAVQLIRDFLKPK